MLKFKKLISIVLVIAFLFTTTDFVGFANEFSAQKTENEVVQAQSVMSQAQPAPLNNTSGNTTLDQNITIEPNSNMYYSSNVVLNGNLTIRQGARLEINGDLTIDGGNITISEDNVVLVVKGKLSILENGQARVSGKSTIEVYKDIEQKGKDINNIHIGDDSTVILKGSTQQTIFFENPLKMGILINENTSGEPLIFKNSLNFEKYFDNGHGITGFIGDERAVTISRRINLFRYSGEGAWMNKELVIHGNLYIKESVDVNITETETDRVTLRVKGDYIQEKGQFKTFGQRMIVEGNFVQKSGQFFVMGNRTLLEVKGNMDISGDSLFRMGDIGCHVIVDGNFTMRSTRSHAGQLTAGTLEIKGDFLQDCDPDVVDYPGSTWGRLAPQALNFCVIDKDHELLENQIHQHRVVLNGEGKQTVTFKTATRINSDKSLDLRMSQFSILVITKPFNTYNFTNDLSRERIYEKLEDLSFDKDNDSPYKLRRNLDVPKSRLGLVNSNGNIYAIGGANGSIIYDTVQMYDPEEDRWSNIGSLNERRMELAAAVANNDIYVFGGFNGFDILDSIERVTSGGTIETIELENGYIIPRRGHQAIYHNGKIYLMGGQNDSGNVLRTLEIFNVADRTVAQAEPMKNVRKDFGAALALVGDKFYIVVAGGDNGTSAIRDVEMYDITEDEWISAGSLITSRKGLGLQFVMGKLFAFGGLSNNGEYLDTVEVFDEDNKTWSTLEKNIYTKRGYFGSTGAFNSIFIAGGEKPEVLNIFEQFMPVAIPGVRFQGRTRGLNGDFTQEETDLVFNSSPMSFDLRRSYNTQFKEDEGDFLGFGWQFNLESSLKVMDENAGKITASYLNVRERPNGRIVGGLEKGTIVPFNISESVADPTNPNRKWHKILDKYYIAGWYVENLSGNGVEVKYPSGIKGYFTEGEKVSDRVEYNSSFGTYEKLYYNENTNEYELITKEQTKYIYSYDSSDKKYRNTKIVDRYGNTVDISYTNNNGAKKLTAVSNSGRKITLDRTAPVNGVSRVTAVDGDNRKVEYTVKDNRLEKVVDTLGLETIYTYNTDNSIRKIEKDGKTFAQITYDDSGRIETYTDAMNNKSHNYYEDVYIDESGDSLKIAGRLKRCVIDNKGHETITTYNLIEKKPVVVVDAEKGITKYKYEIFYNDKYVDVTNLKDSDEFYKDHYQENIMKNQWETRETVTDVNGLKTITEKDERGNIRKISKPDGSSFEYEYDGINNIVKETNNAEGHTVVNQYKYEALNRPERVYLKSVSILDGSKNDNIIYEYYLDKNVYGLVSSKSTLRYDSNNERIVEEYDYNDSGELIKEKIGDRITHIGHRHGSFTTSVDLDVDGRKITVEAPKNSYETGIFYVSAMIKPSGNIGIIQYDSMLNPVKQTLKNSDQTKESTSLIVYDKHGRKVREVSPEIYAKNPSVAHSLNKDCNIYTYYDDGLVKTYQDPENNVTTYIYDNNGNLERETNPARAEYIYEYDGLGRLTRTKFKDPLYGNEEIVLEESFYERGENINEFSKRRASKKTHVKYIDEETSLRTDTYFDYAGRETIIENPYGKVEKEYYGDGSLKSESVFNKRFQYGNSFYDVTSNNSYYYNNKGLLDIIVKAHTIENNKREYFITKYGYTDDGLIDYEINWLDAVELLRPDDGVYLPRNNRASIIRYEYDEIGNVTGELSYIGNVLVESGEPLISRLDFVKRATNKYDGDGNLEIEVRGNEEVRFKYNYLSKPYEIRNIVKRDDVVVETGDNVEIVENDTSLLALITKYDYDKDGNIKTYTSPSNNVVEYKYDNMGRVTDILYHGVKDEYGVELRYLNEKSEYNWQGNVVRSELKAIYPSGQEKIQSQSEYHYNGRGQLLISIGKLDENGVKKDVVHSYAYDNGGRLIAEATPESFSNSNLSGQSVVEKYSVDNAKSKIIYTYDLMGRLKTKEFSGETYQYNPYVRELQKKDETFVVKAYVYDSNDNIIKEVDGKEFKIASARSRNVDEAINNANGTVYTYTLSNNLATVTFPKEVTERKDFSISYHYDGLGNVVRERRLMGADGIGSMVEYVSVTSTTYTQNSDGTITYTSTTEIEDPAAYNAYAQGGITKVWKTDVNGNIIEESIGKRKISIEYNGLGLERKSTKEVDRYLDAGKEVIVNSEIHTFYDVDGNVKTVKNASNNFEINNYDALGRLTAKTIGKKNSDTKDNETTAGDLLKSVTRRWEYDVAGNVRFEYDGNGFKTEYVYDNLNRLKNTVQRYHEEKDPAKRELLSESLREYDLEGNLIASKYRLTDLKNNKSVETRHETFKYDGLGRIVEKAEVDGSTKIPYERINYNENSDQEFSYDADGKSTEYLYDLNRNHIETIDQELNKSKQAYGRCGNIISKTDGEDNTILYYYDVLDRLTKVTYLKNGLDEVEVSTYSYNEEGNIKEQKSGSKNTVTFLYTASDSVKERTTGGKTDTFFYNNDGSLLKRVDNKGNETIYTYTPQGLVETEEVKENGEVVITKEYEYDNNGNPTESVLKTKDGQNSIIREYDNLGRVYKKVATDSITANFKYDIITEDGLIGEVSSYENGKSISKVYDLLGRLKYVYSVDITDGSILVNERNSNKTEYRYDIKGRRESILYPNGSMADYKYYDNNNLKTLTNYVNGVEIEKYEYEYNKNNTMYLRRESYDGVLRGITTYEYDELLRLDFIVERRGGVLYRKVEYDYDDSGNREKEITLLNGQETIKDYRYKEGNILEGYTVTVDGRKQDELQYIYDANGNLTYEYVTFENGVDLRGNAKLKTRNEYNALNQLVKTTTENL
ncbi:UNVERIFIED_CONTAM: YD repeat-containing protein [Acetivibrio alkalicellulosi]